MNVPAKLGLYGVGLVVAFAGALGAGTLTGPVLSGGPAAGAEGGGSGEGGHGGTGEPAAGEGPEAAAAPPGLQVSDGGYTLEPVAAPEEAGKEGELSFRITGPDGEPVTGFRVEHEKRMHLIVVGRDTTGYRHLHPEMDADGLWTVRTGFDTPGPYRMFADFAPEGAEDGLVLGADVALPGDYEPEPLPGVRRVAEVDGYTVRLEGGLAAGGSGDLDFTVTKDGEPVDDLEPYLGAYGHLVALRAGDLAYLHVHPHGEPGDGETEPGPEVRFSAEAPTPGDYRLFLDFKHGGKVRTAEFTAAAGGGAGSGGGHGDDGHGH
ncbi:hypothetical protein [Nocardiopsis composta]|uniref:DUF748 domain-containing protein n=1 Tax=Nocardiopsis composta TaxID=157465 RepID=A0A7W8QQ95_9ACTN|nr:hypothetical protein [Nocardiopsis composta]MBB5433920.1 hypothetical protein [Nocardiopsis composta]